MTSSASNVQLKAYVEHRDTHHEIRASIDAAKTFGDTEKEAASRARMQDYWRKLPALRSAAVEEAGSEGTMLTNAEAYSIMKRNGL